MFIALYFGEHLLLPKSPSFTVSFPSGNLERNMSPSKVEISSFLMPPSQAGVIMNLCFAFLMVFLGSNSICAPWDTIYVCTSSKTGNSQGNARTKGSILMYGRNITGAYKKVPSQTTAYLQEMVLKMMLKYRGKKSCPVVLAPIFRMELQKKQ